MTSAAASIQHQRARGEGRLTVFAPDGVTRVERLHQSGCCKIRLPANHHRGRGVAQEAVLINSSGGMTAGDDLRWQMSAAAGARLTVSTQACERVYRCEGEPARLEIAVNVSEGAHVDWLPQETILFDGGQLSRNLTVNLAADAEALIVEPVIFGRVARGEVVREGALRDRWVLRREGVPFHREALDLAGDVEAILSAAPVAGGHRATATIVFASPRAEALHEAAGALATPTLGVALFDDRIVARALAADGYELRRTIMPLLTLLRDGAALPKVWNT